MKQYVCMYIVESSIFIFYFIQLMLNNIERTIYSSMYIYFVYSLIVNLVIFQLKNYLHSHLSFALTVMKSVAWP